MSLSSLENAADSSRNSCVAASFCSIVSPLRSISGIQGSVVFEAVLMDVEFLLLSVSLEVSVSPVWSCFWFCLEFCSVVCVWGS